MSYLHSIADNQLACGPIELICFLTLKRKKKFWGSVLWHMRVKAWAATALVNICWNTDRKIFPLDKISSHWNLKCVSWENVVLELSHTICLNWSVVFMLENAVKFRAGIFHFELNGTDKSHSYNCQMRFLSHLFFRLQDEYNARFCLERHLVSILWNFSFHPGGLQR